MSTTGLDAHSRDTVARFMVKLGAAAVLAAFGRHYVPALATWAALYGFTTAALALCRRERPVLETFNHWDEALWLTSFALALIACDRML